MTLVNSTDFKFRDGYTALKSMLVNGNWLQAVIKLSLCKPGTRFLLC
jgi:hypothetical protein